MGRQADPVSVVSDAIDAALEAHITKVLSGESHGREADHMANGAANVYVSMTDEEIQLDLLKAAVVNPELYNTMRQLMTNHPYPDRLDPAAKRLRKIFKELESHGT
jgi:hypothetical protein